MKSFYITIFLLFFNGYATLAQKTPTSEDLETIYAEWLENDAQTETLNTLPKHIDHLPSPPETWTKAQLDTVELALPIKKFERRSQTGSSPSLLLFSKAIALIIDFSGLGMEELQLPYPFSSFDAERAILNTFTNHVNSATNQTMQTQAIVNLFLKDMFSDYTSSTIETDHLQAILGKSTKNRSVIARVWNHSGTIEINFHLIANHPNTLVYMLNILGGIRFTGKKVTFEGVSKDINYILRSPQTLFPR